MKTNFSIQVNLTKSMMRRLNPWLKKEGLTIQQAIERGFKKRTPAMYLNVTAYLAALEGVGVNLDRDPLTGQPYERR